MKSSSCSVFFQVGPSFAAAAAAALNLGRRVLMENTIIRLQRDPPSPQPPPPPLGAQRQRLEMRPRSAF